MALARTHWFHCRAVNIWSRWRYFESSRRPAHRWGVWGPPRGGHPEAEPCWGSRGQSPQKQSELNILTLPKIAFPQRNSSKSHFLKRTVLLMTSQLRWLIKIVGTPPLRKLSNRWSSKCHFQQFQGVFPTRKTITIENKKFNKSKFAESSSYACRVTQAQIPF